MIPMAIVQSTVRLGIKEILPAFGRHKRRRVGENIGRLARFCVGRNDEFIALVVFADDGASVVTDVEIEPALNPLLLDELELPEQVRANLQEDNAVFAVIARVAGIVRAVGQPAAQNPAALVQFSLQCMIMYDA